MQFENPFYFQNKDVVTPYDTTGEYIDGVWTESALEPRLDKDGNPTTITAVVLQLSFQQIEFYNQGNESAGGISLITNEILYFTRTDFVEEHNKQTYVEFKGILYRVVGDGQTDSHSNFRCYHALRFVE